MFWGAVVRRPRRVKVEGDLFHCVVPAGAVYVGRGAPGLKASPFMNRHPVGKPCKVCGGTVHTLRESLAAYERDLTPELLARACEELAGRDLACWCKTPETPGVPDLCHAAILLPRVNGTGPYPWRCGYAPEGDPAPWRDLQDIPVTGGVL